MRIQVRSGQGWNHLYVKGKKTFVASLPLLGQWGLQIAHSEGLFTIQLSSGQGGHTAILMTHVQCDMTTTILYHGTVPTVDEVIEATINDHIPAFYRD